MCIRDSIEDGRQLGRAGFEDERVRSNVRKTSARLNAWFEGNVCDWMVTCFVNDAGFQRWRLSALEAASRKGTKRRKKQSVPEAARLWSLTMLADSAGGNAANDSFSDPPGSS